MYSNKIEIVVSTNQFHVLNGIKMWFQHWIEYFVSWCQSVILDYEPIFLADCSYLGKLPANTKKKMKYYTNKEKLRKFFCSWHKWCDKNVSIIMINVDVNWNV